MEVPTDLRYLKTHEWARVAGNETTVGVSEYAVEALNRDIVFVELPAVGAEVRQGQPFGVIEAVKAVYDLYAPVSGRVTAINETLAGDPGVVGRLPFSDGWMIRIAMSDSGELDSLLTPEQYAKQLETEKH